MEFLEIENHFFKIDRDEQGEPYQLQAYHFDPSGSQCGGVVPLGEGEWVLLSDSPLDIRPSIDCDRCPSHYTIVRGHIFDHNDLTHNNFSQIESELVGMENAKVIAGYYHG